MAELVEEAVADVLGVEDVSEISADCTKDASDSTNKLCEIKIPDGVSTPEDFAEKVLELTNGKGLPVVYDGVGKSTFEQSLKCLKTRGTMVSFGNASGALSPIDVPKMLQPKGLFFVRPSMGQYLHTREELNEASKVLFEKISSGKVKIDIFKKYKLDDVVQAHIDLESRKITGAAVIIP